MIIVNKIKWIDRITYEEILDRVKRDFVEIFEELKSLDNRAHMGSTGNVEGPFGGGFKKANGKRF